MPTESAIRQAIAARILTLTSPVQWAESRFAPDLLGLDPSSVAHGCYSVDMPSAASQGRQRRQELIRSQVIVRSTWRLTASPQIASYDASLDAETILIRHLRESAGWIESACQFNLLFQRSARTLINPEWRLVSTTFEALYYLDLEA